MSKVHADRMEKELRSMDLDLPVQFALIWDLLVAANDIKENDIVYSKSYFTRYYCVDLATFNKWIRIFCPDLWSNKYGKKRIFNPEEADYIFSHLGRVTFKKMPPQARKELMKEIYKDSSWKKSRLYEEMALDLEDRFPNQNIRLNKFPPKFIFSVLKEELEDFDDTIPEKQDEFIRSRIHVFQTVLSKYHQLTDLKAEVYRRFMRRWLSAEDDSLE
jgi:hypothetical protein